MGTGVKDGGLWGMTGPGLWVAPGSQWQQHVVDRAGHVQAWVWDSIKQGRDEGGGGGEHDKVGLVGLVHQSMVTTRPGLLVGQDQAGTRARV